MGKELKDSNKNPRRKYSSIHSEHHSKKYQIGKRKDMIAYMDTGFKKFPSIHDRMAIEMNAFLQEADILKWMTKGETTQIKKDSQKGTAPNNYRPMRCLLMMKRILTAQIREEFYYLPINHRLFPE